MNLSNKYNIPQETVNKLVTDGILSSKWPTYEEIHELYKTIKMKSPSKSKAQIYYEISELKKINEHTIKQMVTRMDKI